MERREALARQGCSVRMLGEFSLRGVTGVSECGASSHYVG